MEGLAALMREDKNVYRLTRASSCDDLKRLVPNLVMARHVDELCLVNAPPGMDIPGNQVDFRNQADPVRHG